MEEVQVLFQRGLHLDSTHGRPQTSCHNEMSPRERSLKRRKRLDIKGRGVTLGIGVSHGDCPITAAAGRLVNAHYPLQTGTAS